MGLIGIQDNNMGFLWVYKGLAVFYWIYKVFFIVFD